MKWKCSNAWLFFREAISARVIMAGILGLVGLAFIFLPDVLGGIKETAVPFRMLWGVLLAAAGTFLFSLGNMVSRRNAAHGLPTTSTNAWGMGYGAIILIIVIFATSMPLVIPPSMTYTIALFYLAIFGSVIGFTTYLLLVVRVGSSRAAYATVLFPIVAVTLSALFEDYQITIMTVVGMLFAMAGNVVMFSKIDFFHFVLNRERYAADAVQLVNVYK